MMIPPDLSEIRSRKWFRLFDSEADFNKIDLTLVDENGDHCYNAYLYFSDEELRQMPAFNK